MLRKLIVIIVQSVSKNKKNCLLIRIKRKDCHHPPMYDKRPIQAPVDIGILTPQTNLMVENDFFSIFSTDSFFHSTIHPHFSRIKISTRYKIDKKKYLEESFENALEACSLFKTVTMAAYAFMCTSAAMHHITKTGEFPEKMDGKPLLHPLGSLIFAIKYLSIKKLFVISPYDDEYTLLLSEWIAKEGVVVKHIALSTDYNLPSFTNDRIIDIAKNNIFWKPDLIYIPCTNFHSLPTIEHVEFISPDVLVVNSNQVVIFQLMKMFGNKTSIMSKYGRIFSK